MNGFHPTETELTLMLKRFDRKAKGTVLYHEFMDEVLPSKSLLGEAGYMNVMRKLD
jgi:Ca2+-binding EF-hand superfamily protein